MSCLALTAALQLIALAPDAVADVKLGDRAKAHPSQPFCFERDDLQEYLQALVKHDENWMKSLTGCSGMHGGQDYIVTGIENGDPGAAMTLVKIRVLGTSGSLVGWTVMFPGK